MNLGAGTRPPRLKGPHDRTQLSSTTLIDVHYPLHTSTTHNNRPLHTARNSPTDRIDSTLKRADNVGKIEYSSRRCVPPRCTHCFRTGSTILPAPPPPHRAPRPNIHPPQPLHYYRSPQQPHPNPPNNHSPQAASHCIGLPPPPRRALITPQMHQAHSQRPRLTLGPRCARARALACPAPHHRNTKHAGRIYSGGPEEDAAVAARQFLSHRNGGLRARSQRHAAAAADTPRTSLSE